VSQRDDVRVRLCRVRPMKYNNTCRKSVRLRHYDYSRSGAYFVTICREGRQFYFEKSPELQSVVQVQWEALRTRFPEIELDEFVIMPNHVHGIILVGTTQGQSVTDPRHARPVGRVGATHELPLQHRQNMLLPRLVGYFKMNTAKKINQILNRSGKAFWQRN
jgi:putative transposase